MRYTSQAAWNSRACATWIAGRTRSRSAWTTARSPSCSSAARWSPACCSSWASSWASGWSRAAAPWPRRSRIRWRCWTGWPPPTPAPRGGPDGAGAQPVAARPAVRERARGRPGQAVAEPGPPSPTPARHRQSRSSASRRRCRSRPPVGRPRARPSPRRPPPAPSTDIMPPSFETSRPGPRRPATGEGRRQGQAALHAAGRLVPRPGRGRGVRQHLRAERASRGHVRDPGKGTWYRVRLGGFQAFQDAVDAKMAFERRYNKIALVVGPLCKSSARELLEHQPDVEVQAAVAGSPAAGSSGQAQEMQMSPMGSLNTSGAMPAPWRKSRARRPSNESATTPVSTNTAAYQAPGSGTAGRGCAGCACCRPAGGTGRSGGQRRQLGRARLACGRGPDRTRAGWCRRRRRSARPWAAARPRPAGSRGRSAGCGAGPAGGSAAPPSGRAGVVLRKRVLARPGTTAPGRPARPPPAAGSRGWAPAGCPGAATRRARRRLPTVVPMLTVSCSASGPAPRSRNSVRMVSPPAVGQRGVQTRDTSPGRSRWCRRPSGCRPAGRSPAAGRCRSAAGGTGCPGSAGR